MPSFKAGKTEITKMVEVLETPDMTAEEMAQAVIDKAWEMYDNKAKFVVVGQVFDINGKRLHNTDAEAVKVALWPFSTPGTASKAMQELVGSTSSQYMLRSWLLPVHHGTPASFHKTLNKTTIDEDDHRAAKVISTEAKRQAENWCRDISINEETLELVECRREKGHAGEHGLFSPDLGGVGD